jgi:hypothetical protein
MGWASVSVPPNFLVLFGGKRILVVLFPSCLSILFLLKLSPSCFLFFAILCHDQARANTDSTLPVAERRNYKGVGDAFVRIVREDGIGGLFRGATPTIIRAMALNMGMFAANEQAKETIEEYTPLRGLPLTAAASFVAGFFASACSLPFDFVKTRIQKMKPDASGKMPYTGLVDCAMKVCDASPCPFLLCRCKSFGSAHAYYHP